MLLASSGLTAIGVSFCAVVSRLTSTTRVVPPLAAVEGWATSVGRGGVGASPQAPRAAMASVAPSVAARTRECMEEGSRRKERHYEWNGRRQQGAGMNEPQRHRGTEVTSGEE